MARTEIDSFIVKFKSLLLSGRNTTLEIKSNAGKAEVTLHGELGDASRPPAQHQHHPWPRNGPSDELLKVKLQKLQNLVKTVLRKLLVVKSKVKLKKPIFLLRIKQMRTKLCKMSFALMKVLRR